MIKIGPCRIADRTGTHEPDEVVERPSDELVELARSKAVDPETKQPYATEV